MSSFRITNLRRSVPSDFSDVALVSQHVPNAGRAPRACGALPWRLWRLNPFLVQLLGNSGESIAIRIHLEDPANNGGLLFNDGRFDSCHRHHGVSNGEVDLADEVLNSYVTVYPHAARIIEALSGIITVLKGKELDKRAPHSAGQWPRGEYSPDNFRQLVVELGIVGRVRKMNEASGFIEGDFEYASRSRLPLLVSDDCVINLMFYKKLNVLKTVPLPVYHFRTPRSFVNWREFANSVVGNAWFRQCEENPSGESQTCPAGDKRFCEGMSEISEAETARWLLAQPLSWQRREDSRVPVIDTGDGHV